MNDWDPFRHLDYDPAEKCDDPLWEVNPKRPPPQARQVWDVAKRHFPGLANETQCRNGMTAIGAVIDVDDSITYECAQCAILEEQHTSSIPVPSNSYIEKQSVSSVLRKKLKAITTADANLWREACNETTAAVRAVEADAEAELDFDDVTLSESIEDLAGPNPDLKINFGALWERRRAVLVKALELSSKGGRPSAQHRDAAVRAAISLWENLSSEIAVQPPHKAGTSERTSPMVEFVCDVLDVYSEFGMKGAVSVNSGAFWNRVLPAKI